MTKRMREEVTPIAHRYIETHMSDVYEIQELRRAGTDTTSGSVANAVTFPYPVGTMICKDFGEEHGGVFVGRISCLYPDDTTICGVLFTDGDSCDMSAVEIREGIDLFNGHSARVCV